MPEAAAAPAALISSPLGVLGVLLAVLALLFGLNRTRPGSRLFSIVPLLVFCYFVPALLSNTGVIPLESDLYTFIRRVLLPASLLLLVLATDIPAVIRLGRDAVVLFLTGTASVLLGGPLAFLALGWMFPQATLDQAWRGLAALCGSWIGGGANFVAVGDSVQASPATMSLMVVVDVAVANVWMAILLWFAGREAKMDARVGADRSRIDEVRARVETYQAEGAPGERSRPDAHPRIGPREHRRRHLRRRFPPRHRHHHQRLHLGGLPDHRRRSGPLLHAAAPPRGGRREHRRRDLPLPARGHHRRQRAVLAGARQPAAARRRRPVDGHPRAHHARGAPPAARPDLLPRRRLASQHRRRRLGSDRGGGLPPCTRDGG